MKYVTVGFPNTYTKYHYVCKDDDVKEGDYYVVFPREFPAVARVEEVSDTRTPKATKYLGPRIEESSRKEVAVLNHNLQKRNHLEKKLNARIKEVMKTVEEDYVIKNDSEAAAIKAELDLYV